MNKSECNCEEVNLSNFDDKEHFLKYCESEEEMIDLYELINSDDEDISISAYSHWCAGTSHNLVT